MTNPVIIPAQTAIKIEKNHLLAMNKTEEAIIDRKKGRIRSSELLFLEAFLLESEAADLIAPFNLEPSRSVLFLSAATLACDCKEYRNSRALIIRGNTDNTDSSIKKEFVTLLERIEIEELSLSQKNKKK